MFAAHTALKLPLDPVTLSYVMALRGVRPRIPSEAFSYGEFGCGTAERLILLAASNPEGIFFGFDPDLEKLNKAADKAEAAGVKNLTFAQATTATLKEAAASGAIAKKCFSYIVYDDVDNSAKEGMTSLRACAEDLLQDSGVLAYRYRLYDENNADTLLFESLTRHILAEQPQADETLAKDWRDLCSHFFAAHPDKAAAFDKALADGKGRAFLRDAVPAHTKTSKAVQVSQAFAGQALTLLGSAQIANNYMELSTPEAAHAALEARRNHPLYESLKDLAMGSETRIDIWAREPLTRIANNVTLFGGFTFGTTESAENIARTVQFQGKNISFAGPLYDSILSLASVMPVTMGDLVTHESLQEVDAATVLNTLQLLVACHILQPMRASFEAGIDMENPKLIGGYNKGLSRTTLDLQDYAFASSITGRPVILSGMNALVLQALHKGGLNNIALHLSDELTRLADHPHLRPLALHDQAKAVEEAVRQIDTIFHQSMTRWFSLGIIHSEHG